MKVLFVIESLGRGGAERALVNMLPSLQEHGVQCEVVMLFSDDTLAIELEAEGICVYKLSLSHRWNLINSMVKLHKLVNTYHYDIVHAHLFFACLNTGMLSFFSKKIRLVATFHNLTFDVYPADTVIKRVRKYLEKFIMHRFSGCTAVSRSVRNHYSEHLQLRHIEVIPNAFPIDRITAMQNPDAQTSLGSIRGSDLPEDAFVILTPGRLVKEKGHEYLLQAIHHIESHHKMLFVWAGGGPLKPLLESKRLENVLMLGSVQYTDLLSLYQRADLVVIPSIFEAFGMVVGESMIMQRAIIATSAGGIPEIIEDQESGVIVPPGNSKALAEAIASLYEDPTKRKRLATRARKQITYFDVKRIAPQWKKYYQALLVNT